MLEDTHSNPLPPLSRDHTFWGMTSTQFLGAFNDNLFKQLVLLLCVERASSGGADYQPVAMALFAIPFVLFSGFGGYLSDCNSKRRTVVICKVAEIVVMAAGLVAFLNGQLLALFVVLFLMSTQSAFFGPAKYGILPELFRDRDLPVANGVIQMTTFVAIIFGMALAGFAKDWFEGRLWVVSTFCIVIAIVGTLTSLAIRRTRIAHPGLRFDKSALGINHETWTLLREDRTLFGILMISSLFWLVGGVVQPTVNAFGILEFGMTDSRASLLAACMGVGIALGCVVAGKASHHRINFRLVTIGAWGISAALVALAALGHSRFGVRFTPPAGGLESARMGVISSSARSDPESAKKLLKRTREEIETLTKESDALKKAAASGRWIRTLDSYASRIESEIKRLALELGELLVPANQIDLLARMLLTSLGFAAGLFVVPLQVCLQTRPPEDQKGRMIGTMNLVNWIGIVLSAGFYQLGLWLAPSAEIGGDTVVQVHWIFAALALLMLPVALWYRPQESADKS